MSSAPINNLNDSEEEELGALIYKSSQTAKKFLGLGSSASASASASASGGASNPKKRAGPPAEDCPARNEGCKLIHESSAPKKLKVEEVTDESFCTGDMPQQKESQASEFKRASPESESDNEDDSSDDEYPAEPSSSITSHTASKRYNLRRASHRQASNGATDAEPGRISSAAAASTTPPSLSSTYCAVINEDRKSAEMGGTYTDRKGREFVIERFAGKKYKHYCKPEGANEKVPRARLLCKHNGCTNIVKDRGVCVKHGAKAKRCKVEGCTNQEQTNHLCRRHGAPKIICKHTGCTNVAKGRGVCKRHGYTLTYCAVINEDGKPAEEEGTYIDKTGREFVIERFAGKKYKQYCKPEGANEKVPRKRLLCKHNGCHKNAQAGGGVCVKHGAKTKRCKVEGCTNQSVTNHLCKRHGARAPKKICKHNGCTTQIVKRGVCKRHGASDNCKHEACLNKVVKSGLCRRHGALKQS